MGRRKRRRYIEGQGERIQLTLTDMAYQGMALGRYNDEVVFVAYGIPGETVEAEVLRRHKTYIEAKVIHVMQPSPYRTEAPCPYYGECGGCQMQHITYGHQLELKRGVVIEQLRHIGKFPDPPVAPTLGAEAPWHYRNHARFTVNKEGRLGFVRWGTHRSIPVEACLLLDPWINQTLQTLQGCRDPSDVGALRSTDRGMVDPT